MTTPTYSTHIVGFTGTRQGMTPEQKATVRNVFGAVKGTLLVHGDCVGADSDAHDIAKALDMYIRVRPCTMRGFRAHRTGDERVEPAGVMERNRAIVNDCAVLVATPPTFEEILRSGTWATIRYARKVQKAVCIIWPDGTFKAEGDVAPSG